MKKTFTPEEIYSNKGCYTKQQVSELSFINKKTIHINDVLKSDIPLKDKSWFLCRKCELTKDQNVFIAIECANIVLHIFEDKYPEDKRPRKAIEAAKEYLKTGNNNDDADDAAYAAAYAAADAAAYAYAAAYAARNISLQNSADIVRRAVNLTFEQKEGGQ